LKHNKLFEPIQIGDCWIKNRIALAPINLQSLSDEYGGHTQRATEYYVEFAKGGVGLIISGVFKVENEVERLGDIAFPPRVPEHLHCTWPLLITPGSLRMYSEMMQRIHAYGSKMFFQLSAGPGRNAWWPGYTAVSASEIPVENNPNVSTRALTTSEVEKLVDAFGVAAAACYSAGVDGVEIHGHEGYLIDQFLTKNWNHRTDKYGGSPENRARFPIEILNRIKDTVGRRYPVEFRMGMKHFIESGPNPKFKYGSSAVTPWNASLDRTGYEDLGRDVPESMEIVKLLAEAGYDGFHVDAGCHESTYWAHPPTYFGHPVYPEYAEMVKKVVNVPVMTVGRLDDPDVCEDILEKGMADMCAIGRGLLADPYWPKKVQTGAIEDIRPCLGCQEGCLNFTNYIGCQVNPVCGREILYGNLTPALTKKRVMVVGGGVAGLEAARVATIRGHDVTLYERSTELGGHLIEAGVPDFKKDYRRLLQWYKVQLEKLKVKVEYNTDVTYSTVKEKKPDAVIVATGSSPLTMDISGTKSLNVVTCCDLLNGSSDAGDSVVVIGGGSVGCETALWLSRQGKKVVVIEALGSVARDMQNSNRKMLLDLLKREGVAIFVNTSVLEIGEDGVATVDKNFAQKTHRCDTVALALGMKPERDLYKSLVREMPEVYAIGDCVEPRRIQQATFNGYTVAMTI
jgi:2-enoate reductase